MPAIPACRHGSSLQDIIFGFHVFPSCAGVSCFPCPYMSAGNSCMQARLLITRSRGHGLGLSGLGPFYVMVAERAPLLTGCELITVPRHGSQAALYQLLLLPSAEPFWLGRQSYMCRGILAVGNHVYTHAPLPATRCQAPWDQYCCRPRTARDERATMSNHGRAHT